MKSPLENLLPESISTRDLAARSRDDVTVNLTVNIPGTSAAPPTGTVVPGRATQSAGEVSPKQWGEAPPLPNSAPPEQLSRSTQEEFLPREATLTYPAVLGEEVLGHVHRPTLTGPPPREADYSVPEYDYKSYSPRNEEQNATPKEQPGEQFGYPASYPSAATATGETHGARVEGALGDTWPTRREMLENPNPGSPPRKRRIAQADDSATPLGDCLDKMKRGNLI
jgi:hypothetical protein